MKYTYLILFGLVLIGCASSSKINKENKCPKIYKNNFTEIISEKYITVSKGDTIQYNEIRFECTYAYSSTQKVMFDNYGKWDETLKSKFDNHYILAWNDVDLFANGKKYMVFTHGLEEWKHIYGAVMVFDKEGNDLLTIESKEKESIIKLFSGYIRKSNYEDDSFSLAYRADRDISHYKGN